MEASYIDSLPKFHAFSGLYFGYSRFYYL